MSSFIAHSFEDRMGYGGEAHAAGKFLNIFMNITRFMPQFRKFKGGHGLGGPLLATPLVKLNLRGCHFGVSFEFAQK